MPNYVLNRNYTLRSVMGHTINFTKGAPTYVPPLVEKEVVAIGGEREDGKTLDPLIIPQGGAQGVDPGERRSSILSAFELIVDKNDPKDFTGQGSPSVKAVERIVEFDTDRSEIAGLWAEFRASRVEG